MKEQENVIIYTSAICPVCNMLRDFLTNMNITYKEVNVDLNPLAMMKIVGKTRRLSVPQTNMYGKWIIGFNPVRMLEVLSTHSTEV